MIDIMRSLAIWVYHEILLSDQSEKNKIRGVLEREKKLLQNLGWETWKKEEKKNYGRHQQYMPVTGIYTCRYCSLYLCVRSYVDFIYSIIMV